MTASASSTGIFLVLMAGALLAGSGFFMILGARRGCDFIAGTLIFTSGVNACGILFSRHVAGARTWDPLSFFIVVAAVSAAMLSFAFSQAGSEGEKGGIPPEKSVEGGEGR